MKVEKKITTDVLIIGGGVAGLMAASHLRGLKVHIVSKARKTTGGPASGWAQGGIAAATGEDDSPELHAADTHIAGADLCDEEAVDIVAREGKSVIEELLAYGTKFDRELGGKLARGREAAHSRSRVLHAGGDRTGAEILRALHHAVEMESDFTFANDSTALALRQLSDGRVIGAFVRNEITGEIVSYTARAVVLATGGAGGLFTYTTNPLGALAQGIGLAALAGAAVSDVEFVQFHPTALNAPGLDPLPLITEALRGAGAKLVNNLGERFMARVDPRGELAPRDIVARAVAKELAEGRAPFLDGRQSIGAEFPDKFPTAFRSCLNVGIDPRFDLIPVAPAAHYHMGGVVTDVWGRTTLPGLWACGEVACTGLHGANRLASNSLLEGLVFGRRVAASIHMGSGPIVSETSITNSPLLDRGEMPALLKEIRETMWNHVGLLRHHDGLIDAEHSLAELAREAVAVRSETALAAIPAWLIARSARIRTESRGGHARLDMPETSPHWQLRVLHTLQPDLGVRTSLLPINLKGSTRRRAAA